MRRPLSSGPEMDSVQKVCITETSCGQDAVPTRVDWLARIATRGLAADGSGAHLLDTRVAPRRSEKRWEIEAAPISV
jgi:hypothetical protein